MCGFKAEEEETVALYRQVEIQVVTADPICYTHLVQQNA